MAVVPALSLNSAVVIGSLWNSADQESETVLSAATDTVLYIVYISAAIAGLVMDQIDEQEERSAVRNTRSPPVEESVDSELPLPLPPPVSYALQRLSEKRKCHKTLSLPPIISRRSAMSAVGGGETRDAAGGTDGGRGILPVTPVT